MCKWRKMIAANSTRIPGKPGTGAIPCEPAARRRLVLALIGRNGIEIKRGEVLASPLLDRDGRHGCVVGAQGQRRNKHLNAFSPRYRLQCRPQCTIRADAAADCETFFIRLAKSLPTLGDKNVDDRLLKAGGEIGANRTG